MIRGDWEKGSSQRMPRRYGCSRPISRPFHYDSGCLSYGKGTIQGTDFESTCPHLDEELIITGVSEATKVKISILHLSFRERSVRIWISFLVSTRSTMTQSGRSSKRSPAASRTSG